MLPFFEQDLDVILLVKPIIARPPRFAWICKADAKRIQELGYEFVDFTQGDLVLASASTTTDSKDA